LRYLLEPPEELEGLDDELLAADPLPEDDAALPLSPPGEGRQALPVMVSLPFTQFLSLAATFADFFADLSCDAVLSWLAELASLLAIDVLPLGVVVLAEAVVSVDSDPLVEPLSDPLVVLLADPFSTPELVLPVELPLAGLYVFGLAPVELLVAGAVGVAELFCCFDFWRSPIASALALPSAKMEIRNTGASLRIWGLLSRFVS